MEDKEVLKNYDDNSNNDKDSSREINKLDFIIDELKNFITKEYTEELLKEIGNRLNFEKLKDTPSIIKESSNKIQSLSLELNNLKEEDIPNILKNLEEIVDEKFRDLKNNEINEFKEKYKIIENNSNLVKENSDKIQDLKLETDNLKTSILKELGGKINGLDEKYFGIIENLKNNEISKLDTKYSEVLGKFDNLKDDIIREKDERIDDKEKELQEIKKYNIELNQKLEREKESTKNQTEILNEKIKELEVENNSNKVSLETLKEQMKLKEVEIERKARELEEKTAFIQKLTQDLEQEKANNKREVNTLNEQLREKKAELVMKNDQLTFLGEEIRNQKAELKEKEYQFCFLKIVLVLAGKVIVLIVCIPLEYHHHLLIIVCMFLVIKLKF